MSAPSSPQAYGDLYFQPTRKSEDTGESYGDRLGEINSEVAKEPAPKLSPGSFVLLTQRDASGKLSGETRFDAELATLEGQEAAVKKEIQRYDQLSKQADAGDKKIYTGLIKAKEGELVSLATAKDTLKVVGAEHYATAKQDESFIKSPRPLKADGLNRALELVGSLRGKQVGGEISIKRAAQIKEVQNELSELRFNTKNLLAGKLPQEVRNDLNLVWGLLEKIIDYDGSQPLDPPSDVDLERVKKTVVKILDGDFLETMESVTSRSPEEVLSKILVDEAEITTENLTRYGLPEEEASQLFQLLVSEGIVNP